MNTSRIAVRFRSPLVVAALTALLVPGAGVAARQSPGASAAADPFPMGKAVVDADFGGTVLKLYSYKPANYDGRDFVLLFHGASRAAERYRDAAVGMADAYGFLVVVPLFDAERFPSRLYQFGGVFREDGSPALPEERTYAFVPKLAAYIRGREGKPDMPWVLAGFSAGGQFVSRMAAFLDTDAQRLVVMSPGSTLFPTRDLDFGLGFGGLPDSLSNDDRIRRYLALPITVYVGTRDTAVAQLPTGDAYDQGVHRYSRALHWFADAMDLAYRKKWSFNWRLVTADGPGHSPPDMFDHPQIGNALFGDRPNDLGSRLAAAQKRLSDWPNLARYRDANAELGPSKPGERRVVFYGNSITDSWARWFPAQFPGKPYVGRGISGQTTPQMLVRFRQDVVDLKPAAVVILAGTNDIAGNTGPSTPEMIEGNLTAMVELARANGIRVVLCSVLPAYDYPWKRGVEPAPKIVALNAWMKAYAAAHDIVYVDYWSAMADARQGMRADLSLDGVHPNEAGYRIMARLVEPAIERALGGR